jgi:hypothetical protein
VTGTVRALRPRHFLVPSLIALALVSSACAGTGTDSDPRSRPPQQGTPAPVRELTSIEGVRDAFNDHAGSTRLILLISPT